MQRSLRLERSAEKAKAARRSESGGGGEALDQTAMVADIEGSLDQIEEKVREIYKKF